MDLRYVQLCSGRNLSRNHSFSVVNGPIFTYDSGSFEFTNNRFSFSYRGLICRLEVQRKLIYYDGLYWERLLELGAMQLRAGQDRVFNPALALRPEPRPRKPRDETPVLQSNRFRIRRTI